MEYRIFEDIHIKYCRYEIFLSKYNYGNDNTVRKASYGINYEFSDQ